MKRFLSYILAAVVIFTAAAYQSAKSEDDIYDCAGAVVRHNSINPTIYWVFSADSLFEGGQMALDVLKEKNIKASFFFTGNFLRESSNNAIIKRTIYEGHYVGAHGDKHLQLAHWDRERTPLVSKDSLLKDYKDNISELEKFGVCVDSCRWFMPSYEWISKNQVSVLEDSLKIKVLNPTPNILMYRDYTTPDMKDYLSSDSIIRQLYKFEQQKNLSGAILIMHLGTPELRADKLYYHLPAIIDSLQSLGYKFDRLR